MSLPFWDDSTAGYVQFRDPGEWDTVYLAGTRVPGVCDVKSAATRRIETLPPVGSEAARVNDHGRATEQVNIDCVIWMPKHLDEWEALVKALELSAGPRGNPKAVDVRHPALNALGIRSLYVISIGLPEREPGGVRRFRIRAQEWKPLPKTNKAAKAGSKVVPYSQSQVDAILSAGTAADQKLSVDTSRPTLVKPAQNMTPLTKPPSKTGWLP